MSKIAGEINHHMMRNAKTRAINAPALDLIADILEQHTAGILAGVKEHMDKRKSEARSAGFDAADMATAAAQGFRDGLASLTAQAAESAIENCPELNMGNYDEVDVERLNDWAIRANDEIDRLHALAAGQATAAPAQPAAQQGAAYAALPEPLAIDWPELHSQALGCGVEDRGLHNRYECAEYGWQDGVDKCAERVPEQIFDVDQMHAFADATYALRASHGQAPAPEDSVLEDAARYRLVRRGQHWSVIDGLGNDLRAPRRWMQPWTQPRSKEKSND